MTDPVFYAPLVSVGDETVPLADVREDDETVHLRGAEAHHAKKVQRLKVGERLDLVDGAGFRLLGAVSDTAGEGLAVKVLQVVHEPRQTPAVVLVQALAKSGRDEQAVEVATELGVDEIIPWQADRSIVRWDQKKANSGRKRWERLVQAAAKQSRRAWIPEVAEALTTNQLVAAIATETSESSVILVCHESATKPLRETLLENDADFVGAKRCLVLVGPEGGISETELRALVAVGAQPVKLGTAVLRSSTAGPAAIVGVNLALGRW